MVQAVALAVILVLAAMVVTTAIQLQVLAAVEAAAVLMNPLTITSMELQAEVLDFSAKVLMELLVQAVQVAVVVLEVQTVVILADTL
jgi:hypothetical protein